MQIRIVVLLIGFSFWTSLVMCQKFEVINASVDVRGLTEDNGQMVIFGNGLTWINLNGEVQGNVNLIPEMPITFIVNALSDGKGGMWVLTRDALGYVNSNKVGVKILDAVSLDTGMGKVLKRGIDGSLYAVFTKKIIKISPDHTYKIHFAPPHTGKEYFEGLEVDADGTMYIANQKELLVVDPSGKMTHANSPDGNSVGFVQRTNDGKLMVQGYYSIYEYVNNKLELRLAQGQLSSGAKFMESVFVSSDDYWLYSNEGNAFHFFKGSWYNYIPPAGMRTGNFGECMIRTKVGHIWMSLSGYPYLLQFDGSKWSKIEVKQNKPNASLNASYWAGDLLVGTASTTLFPLQYNGASFEAIPGMPEEKTWNIKRDESGQLYWSTEKAIYTRKNNQNIKVTDANQPRHFEIMGNELMYVDSGKICILKDGKRRYYRQNENFMGWEELNAYSTVMTRTADHHIMMMTSRRSGLISIYGNGQWNKIIEIDGQMIGPVDHMITYGNKTYLFNLQGSVALYEDGRFRWLYFSPNKKATVRRCYVTPDQYAWYTDENNVLHKINDSGLVNAVPLPMDKTNNMLNAIVPAGEDVYDLYFEKTLLRVDYNGE